MKAEKETCQFWQDVETGITRPIPERPRASNMGSTQSAESIQLRQEEYNLQLACSKELGHVVASMRAEYLRTTLEYPTCHRGGVIQTLSVQLVPGVIHLVLRCDRCTVDFTEVNAPSAVRAVSALKSLTLPKTGERWTIERCKMHHDAASETEDASNVPG